MKYRVVLQAHVHLEFVQVLIAAAYVEDAFYLVDVWILIKEVDQQEKYFRHVIRVLGRVQLLEMFQMAEKRVVLLFAVL
jgi:hypothetical protein